MDREKIVRLKEILDEFGENKPTAEDLNYGNDSIELYDQIFQLKEALENIGY